MSLSHQQAQGYLQEKADGMLSAGANRKLQRHLAHCAECQTYAAKLATLETRLTQSLQTRWPSPKDARAAQTVAVVQARARKKRWLRNLYHSSQTVAWAGLVVALILSVGWLLTSTAPRSPSAQPETAIPTLPNVPTVTMVPPPPPTATATPPVIVEKATATTKSPPDQERALTICLGNEPDSLYLYNSQALVSASVLEAVYDGPIDNLTFDYQPVILEKLPTLSNGDAILKKVKVAAGDWVVNDVGDPVVLEKGVMLRPLGCYDSKCAVEFSDVPLTMEQLIVIFKIEPGILWSDGEPLTAYDSVYSFELDKDPATPTDKEFISRTASYEATSDYSTVWTGLPGYRNSQYMTQFWTPLPEHLWGKLTATELLNAKESRRYPLGWGPYVIESWVLGNHISLVKNENYWRAGEGLPHFDQITMRFVGGKSSANVAALLAGECDIVDQTANLSDQSELLLELQAVGQVNATFVTGTVWEHADFGIVPAQDYERPDFFGDVRVRQAIAYCMDRRSVVRSVMYGQSKVLNSYLPSEHPLFDSTVKQYRFDVNKGTALLKQVGWIDDDENPKTPRVAQGVEGVPDGTPLTFNLATTSATQRQAATKILQDSLARCGVEVNLDYWSPGEFFADGPEGPLFGRHFDIGQFAWLTGIEPGCELYLCSEIPSEENDWQGSNNTGFCNAAYDAACTQARQSLPGTLQYEQAHKQAQRIFADELPVVPLYLRLKLAATRPDMQGFIMDPTAQSEFWNIEEFDYGE